MKPNLNEASIAHKFQTSKKGPILNSLEEKVIPPVSDMDVVEPNITLVIASVVLVVCLV